MEHVERIIVALVITAIALVAAATQVRAADATTCAKSSLSHQNYSLRYSVSDNVYAPRRGRR